jgi:hypothetical protein
MGGPGVSHQLSCSARASGHYLLLDHACRNCVACEAGWPAWCEQPSAGEPLCSVPEELGSTEAAELLSAASAFLCAAVPSSAVVLAVAARGQESILDLLRLVHSGTVLLAFDPRDALVKNRLAELSPIGRADVVVSLLSGRDGVLAVKRGGTVCLGGGGNDMPSVTELAQREVRVLGPRDISELVKKVGRESVEMVFERSS